MNFVKKKGDLNRDEIVDEENKLLKAAFESTTIQVVLRRKFLKEYDPFLNLKKLQHLTEFFRLKLKKWSNQIKHKEEFKYELYIFFPLIHINSANP